MNEEIDSAMAVGACSVGSWESDFDLGSLEDWVEDDLSLHFGLILGFLVSEGNVSVLVIVPFASVIVLEGEGFNQRLIFSIGTLLKDHFSDSVDIFISFQVNGDCEIFLVVFGVSEASGGVEANILSIFMFDI